eukprot:NODE_252_length_1746_cov_479.193377.p1 GENE.NODE_252_length_1746_cov_479.193377~~NODE_252_length_1746_cov_479.193377.p1  ORF type:complete len:537 (+),score=181.75 NODE_252_length_1746_cov_479.193377:3-1613(+)
MGRAYIRSRVPSSVHARAYENAKQGCVPYEPGTRVTLKGSSARADVTSRGYVVGIIRTDEGDKVHVVFDDVGARIMSIDEVCVVAKSTEDIVSGSIAVKDIGWEPVNYSSSDGYCKSLAMIFLGPQLTRTTPAGTVEYKREWQYLNLLLVFVPLVFWTEFDKIDDTFTFTFSFLAIIPLAGLLGVFTEDLSCHVGSAIGALLNASFGNATEIIISFFAVQSGLFSVIKNSMLGSVMSNMLLVLGCAFVARSISNGTEVRKKETTVWSFNAQAANLFATLLLLSTFCLVIPTAFAQLLVAQAHIRKDVDATDEFQLFGTSRGAAIIMMLVYTVFLFFQVRNTGVFAAVDEGEDEEEQAKLSKSMDIIGLGIITVGIAFVSEYLVGSLEDATKRLHLSEAFVAVILIPIVGNAAEHVTAVSAAYRGNNGKGDMECAIGVAIGSSIQIAGFAVPLLVIISWIVNGTNPTPIMKNGRPTPGGLDMNFHPFPMIVMTLSVIIVNTVLTDGKGNWLEGVALIASYVVVAVVFWFVPLEPPKS